MTTFSDNFNRADGPPGANWVLVSGAWVISSNQLSPGASGATVVILAATGMSTSDNFAQVTIAVTTPVSQGVFCRGDSTLANGYVLRNDGSTWAIFKAVSGTFTNIGSFAAAAVAGDVAKIQAVGSTITGTINGIVRISVTDTAITSGTGTGLRSVSTNSLRYDDFSAGDVTSGTTATAGLAAVAVAALQPAAGPAALPGTAAVAVAALQPGAGVAALSGLATVAGTAYGPRSGAAVSAGPAAVAATALGPAAGVAALPGTASAPVAAYPATASGSSSTTATAGLAAVTVSARAPVPGSGVYAGTAQAAGTVPAPHTAIVVAAGRAPVAGTAYGVRNLRPPSTNVTTVSGREPAASVGGLEPVGSVSGREPGTQA